MFRNLRIYIFALLVVILSGCSPAVSLEPKAVSPCDSSLKSYFKIVKRRVATCEVLPDCDTLFARAKRAGNLRMQVIALSLRLDYYFYRNDRAHILEATERVCEFCRANGKNEFAPFYYFAWGGRLITFYIRQGQFSSVIYEAKKMIAEARADNYGAGIASGYRILANAYLMQENFKKAYENYRLEIEQYKQIKVQDRNLPMQYASMAQSALGLNWPDSAARILREAHRLKTTSPYQRFTINKVQAIYYMHVHDLDSAKICVDSARLYYQRDSSKVVHQSGMCYLLTEYYKATRQYDKALEVALAAQKDSMYAQVAWRDFDLYHTLGEIYYLKNDPARAAENYCRYIRAADSARLAQLRNSTEHFSGLIDVTRLQDNAKQVQYDLQHERLHDTYRIIGLLVLFLVLGAVFLVRFILLNRRLKTSEELIMEQNKSLTAAAEELRVAKEAAESASRITSEFIKNMSHEVRTPLNAIVGFSQALAVQYRDNPSTGEYASIIESSSHDLLRLIDDVLDVSCLDQYATLPSIDVCDLNTVCRECIDASQQRVKSGVTLVFEESSENPTVQTNVRRVAQILRHLLHNAAKFTDHGEIILNYTYLAEEQALRFTVSDTGIGIPADKVEMIFDRFVKLDSFAQGTGLGLSIARDIACKLGGSLRLDKTYQSGCCFILTIPLYPNQE